jgi:hypothetical protein
VTRTPYHRSNDYADANIYRDGSRFLREMPQRGQHGLLAEGPLHSQSLEDGGQRLGGLVLGLHDEL